MLRLLILQAEVQDKAGCFFCGHIDAQGGNLLMADKELHITVLNVIAPTVAYPDPDLIGLVYPDKLIFQHQAIDKDIVLGRAFQMHEIKILVFIQVFKTWSASNTRKMINKGFV